MFRLAASVLALAGCGRVGFGGSTDAAIDAVPDYAAGIRGLVARYPMDDDPQLGTLHATAPALDASCAKCPLPRGGRVGGAYQMTGDLRIELPSEEWVGNAAFTVALWIHPESSAQNQSVINKVVPATDRDVLSLLVGTNGSVQYETTAADNTLVFFPGPTPDTRFAWHHVGMTWDGSVRHLYLDGVAIGTDGTQTRDSGAKVAIGADFDNADPLLYYTGGIDDLRFYDRALATDEIAMLAAPP